MVKAHDFPAPSYPTPVYACPALSTADAELWIKNDGLTHPRYGGNKVRKVTALLADAVRAGYSNVLTFGAAGSHHVLTTAVFARAAGLRAAAVLVPQPESEHAEQTLRASVAQGLATYTVSSPGQLASALRSLVSPDTYVIPPGGSNVLGTLAYRDAGLELMSQIEAGLAPLPDEIVVPLGSGGTCAGLLSALAGGGLNSRVIGVLVASNPGARWLVQGLAGAALKRLRKPVWGLSERLGIAADQVGRGYGFATPAGERALRLAAELGLTLDATYTAKAFAYALERVSAFRAREKRLKVLYWHTLSAAAIEPLLEGTHALNAELAPLLRRSV